MGFQAACGKGAAEEYLFGILRDVDKSAASGNPGAELGNIDVSEAVGLRQPQKSIIDTAAIVKVKLIGLIQDCLRIDRTAEFRAALRHAPHGAGFYGKGHVITDSLFVRHHGNVFGDADPKVYDGIGDQFHRRSASDDLFGAHGRVI